MAGFAVFAGADVIYDRSIANSTYHLGTPLDATWAIGLALMTLWAIIAGRRPSLCGRVAIGGVGRSCDRDHLRARVLIARAVTSVPHGRDRAGRRRR